jgi:hypothetical protein
LCSIAHYKTWKSVLTDPKQKVESNEDQVSRSLYLRRQKLDKDNKEPFALLNDSKVRLATGVTTTPLEAHTLGIGADNALMPNPTNDCEDNHDDKNSNKKNNNDDNDSDDIEHEKSKSTSKKIMNMTTTMMMINRFQMTMMVI